MTLRVRFLLSKIWLQVGKYSWTLHQTFSGSLPQRKLMTGCTRINTRNNLSKIASDLRSSSISCAPVLRHVCVRLSSVLRSSSVSSACGFRLARRCTCWTLYLLYLLVAPRSAIGFHCEGYPSRFVLTSLALSLVLSFLLNWITRIRQDLVFTQIAMWKLSQFVRNRIVSLKSSGISIMKIMEILEEEGGIKTSRLL